MIDQDVNTEYSKLLQERLEYFKNKSILELKDEEIQEFINLRKEIEGHIKEVVNFFKNSFDGVIELIKDTPTYKAQIMYEERVLNRSDSE